jgi:hypothetical protein
MNIDDAFSTAYHPWEKEENPQSYQQLPQKYINEAPKRHILGLVGGNEVSLIKGNMVDLESDLRGINIPNTFCPQRQYQAPQPSTAKQAEILRKNTKIDTQIDVRPQHLPEYQMWAYPATFTPQPIKSEVCKNPEKY